MSTETLRCDPSTGRIGSIVVVPSGEKDSEFAIRVVTGMTMSPDDCVRSGYLGGCVVARRALGFIPHQSLELPIRMEASCLDVPCGKTETCHSGSCVSASIPNPRDCAEPAGCDVAPDTSGGGNGGDSSGGGSGGMTSAAGMASATGGSSGSSASAAGTSGILGSGGTAANAGGGSTATSGGAPNTSFTPECTTTATGVGIYKGLACTAADPQLCYWPCGPLGTGHRSETCSSGAYVESGCQFPDTDYSCFKVPLVDSPRCPAAVPLSGHPCNVATCSLPCSGTTCEMCGVSNGYRDSLGTTKVGYCVCAATSNGTEWSCASTSSWPCPAGQGC